MSEPSSDRGPGRPPTTTREQVAAVAFTLFLEHGFEATTMDDIATALGIGRRTLFRYYPSKNDLVWGDFDQVLDRLSRELRAGDQDRPIMEIIRSAAVASNTYPAEMRDELALRLNLIQSVPALQAHSMLRYAEWREVIAAYVAERLGLAADDLVPVATGHAALGASTAAFSRWVSHPREDILELIDQSYELLATAFAVEPKEPAGE